MVDLKIQYLNFDESKSVSMEIQTHAEGLGKFCPQVQSCHVVLTRISRKHHQGDTFQAKLRIHMPGKDIIIDRDPGKNHAHEDIHIAIRDAFLAARRKIDDFNRSRTELVKDKIKIKPATEENLPSVNSSPIWEE